MRHLAHMVQYYLDLLDNSDIPTCPTSGAQAITSVEDCIAVCSNQTVQASVEDCIAVCSNQTVQARQSQLLPPASRTTPLLEG